MTIIQPHKNNYKINFLISIFIVGSLAMAIWGIFLYNQLVNFRHEVTSQENTLRKTEVTNAELKDKLYNLMDTNTFSSSTNPQSLIIDKNPEYVKNQPLMASH